jgi:hypothetical protein
MSFGGFSYGVDSGDDPTHNHPPLFDSPPTHPHNDEDNEESRDEREHDE